MDKSICIVKQLASIFSASSFLFLPIKIVARGAPPFPTNAAKAVIIMISGMQTPTPVSAIAPVSGICPI